MSPRRSYRAPRNPFGAAWGLGLRQTFQASFPVPDSVATATICCLSRPDCHAETFPTCSTESSAPPGTERALDPASLGAAGSWAPQGHGTKPWHPGAPGLGRHQMQQWEAASTPRTRCESCCGRAALTEQVVPSGCCAGREATFMLKVPQACPSRGSWPLVLGSFRPIDLKVEVLFLSLNHLTPPSPHCRRVTHWSTGGGHRLFVSPATWAAITPACRGEKLYMTERGLATIPAHSWGLFILVADGLLVLQACLVLTMVMQVSLERLSLLSGTLRK